MFNILHFTIFNLILSFYPLSKTLAVNWSSLSDISPTELVFLSLYFLFVFCINEFIFLMRGSHRFGLLFHSCIVLLFSWEVILLFLPDVYWVGIGFAGFLSLIFYCIYHLSKKEKGDQVIYKTLLVIGILPFLQLFFSQGYSYLTEPATKKIEPFFLEDLAHLSIQKNIKSNPHVYFLLFDTMSDFDSFLTNVAPPPQVLQLQETFSNFKKEMLDLGLLEIPHSWSNYGRTIPSMPSFFNFSYVTESAIKSIPPSDYYGFKTSWMLKFLKELDFSVVTKTYKNRCPKVFDHCFKFPENPGLTALIFSSTPVFSLLSRFERFFLSHFSVSIMKKIIPNLSSHKLKEVRNFNAYIKNKKIKKQPEFTYVHFQGPHPINYFNENCEPITMGVSRQTSGEEYFSEDFNLNNYAKEYLCFLKKIRQVVSTILEVDPHAWFLVMADHGVGVQQYGTYSSDPWDQRRLDATFKTLAFTKLPKECADKMVKTKTHVNKSRVLMNCILGRDLLGPLPDKISALTFALFKEFNLNQQGLYQESGGPTENGK